MNRNGNKLSRLLGLSVFLLMIGFSTTVVALADETADNSEAFMDLLEEEDIEQHIAIADPIAPWNRAMFYFNDKCYFWILKPVAKGYKVVMPEVARKGVGNFFYNIAMPIRFVNALLQGKGQVATTEFFRFLLNTTAGGLGFGDPASKYPDLNPDAEDLGQTFGRYGIGNGFYIVWPFLGPSSLRDTVGLFGDRFLNPTSYIDPSLAATGVEAYKTVNNLSLKIGEYEALKEAAIEPYVAFRDAYVQYRQGKVEK